MKLITEGSFIKKFNTWLESMNSEEQGQKIIRNSSQVELINLFKRTTGYQIKKL